jgi:hypothetical protein
MKLSTSTRIYFNSYERLTDLDTSFCIGGSRFKGSFLEYSICFDQLVLARTRSASLGHTVVVVILFPGFWLCNLVINFVNAHDSSIVF